MNDIYNVCDVDNNIALEIVVKNHYLKRRCACVRSFGLYSKKDHSLIGVCIFGKPGPSLANGLFGKEEKDNVFELARLWVKDGTPKNTESFFVSKCIKLFKKEIIVSFADPSVGHVGTIYQATNFIYTGLSFKGKDLKIKNSNKSSYIAGSTVQEIKDKYGEENVFYEDRERKHRYIYLNCSKKRKQELLNNLKYKLKEYPKKDTNNIIYGLYDPHELGGGIRYIGRSTSGLERPNEHRKPSQLKKPGHKSQWIKSLIKQGYDYRIEILETLPDFSSKEEREHALNEAEKYHIAEHLTKGAKLTNLTLGGEGNRGYVPSEESRKKSSETHKQWIQKNYDKVMENAAKNRKDYVDGKKHCYECDSLKDPSEFNRNKNTWDKLDYMCKVCDNARVAKRRLLNPSQKLTKEELALNYKARAINISKALKQKHEANPELNKRLSIQNSKAIIAENQEYPYNTLEFPSALEAKKAGFQNSNIGQAIKYGKPYRGYKWKFKC